MQRNSATTYETLLWRGITCRVTTTRNWRIDGWTVITLRYPADVPFPLGAGGFVRHALEQDELEALGGAVCYFKSWADREAKSAAYLNAIARRRQGDLFKQP